MAEAPLRVEVVCALPDRQRIVTLSLPPGTTARDAVLQSQLGSEFPELNIAVAPLAVYGVRVADDYVLGDGDRIDILRPLRRDPREARRELAARGATMGNPASRDGN
jgi:putative ubiquitin-RnfH superfamily antitoxin RatB of RatAB toxin-antitoxin module